MNKWNLFIRSHTTVPDRSIPRRCLAFIREHSRDLVLCGLQQDLQLHLHNLWDSGLVSSSLMSECIAEYQNAEIRIASSTLDVPPAQVDDKMDSWLRQLLARPE